jgi:N-methylhydantoinase A
MAFGGAGPIHAAGVARALGIRKVIVPSAPGVFSAYGLLSAQIEHHAARTVLTPTRDINLGPVQAAIDDMREDLLARVQEEGFATRDVTISAALDLRYRGQSSELTVAIPDDRLTDGMVRKAEEDFEREYERTYGHRGTTKLFELVTVRLVARVARSIDHAQQWIAESSLAGSGARRAVYFGPEFGQVITPVIGRSDLKTASLSGPVLVQEYDTTVVVPPDCTVSIDAHTNIVIEIGSAE